MDIAPTTTSTSTRAMLEALVLVARACGIETSSGSLIRRFSLQAGGLDNTAVVGIASEIGLRARVVNADWRDLPRFAKVLPAILRLRDGGALVLDAFVDDPKTGRMALVRDPRAEGDFRAVVDESQLRSVWTGDVILAKRRIALSDEKQPFDLNWLLRQGLRERRFVRDIGIASVISTIFAIAPPFIVIIVLNRVLLNNSWSTLYVLIIVLLLLMTFESVLMFVRKVFIVALSSRIDGRLNLFITDRLLKLPMDYFERNPGGAIMGKLNKVWQIRQFLTGQVFTAFLDSIVIVLIVPILFLLNWVLAFFVVACGAMIFWICYAYLKPIGRLFRRVIQAEIEKNAHLYESVMGMRTIKSLALEGRRRSEWDVRVARAVSAQNALGLLANYPQTFTIPFERLMYSGSVIGGAIMALIAANQAAGGQGGAASLGGFASNPGIFGTMTPGVVMGFAMLAGRASSPLITLAKMIQDIQELRTSVWEVASVVNETPEEDRAGTGLRMPIHGDITFQGVSFRYSPGASLALDDVNFQIPAGTIFGIMGRSGSGKTTVTRLLQGLNPSYEGLIKIDGMDMREIELHHLRTHVGVVAQESFLFKGSVRENIGMARPDATFAEIVRAAQLAGAEEFIEKLPRGYDTELEESATNLSGGQRQRLAIARALIIDPPVLILDEATSALDAESEAIINANLMRIAKGRTIICVSHRLSMLVPSDAILVMEKGQVYDIGRHEELLHRCDVYKHMWHQQNRHVEQTSAHAPIAVLGTQTAR